MQALPELIDDLDEHVLEALTGHLLSFVTEARVARIDRILAERTRYLTVVLEDLYRMHNANAVVRSCECFGIQDVNVIEASHTFDVNKSIVQGSAKWVTLHRHRGHDGTRQCLERLRNDGYRIVAMSLEPDSVPVETLPLDRPLALCFGSEEPGLTPQARRMADISATIPMQGFTQSLNLSVSAGIALQRLGDRLRASDLDWRIGAPQRDRLRALWLARSISAGRHIVSRFLDSAQQ